MKWENQLSYTTSLLTENLKVQSFHSATRAEWLLDISATVNMSLQLNEVNIPDQVTMGIVKYWNSEKSGSA